jgi:hypothetical protein
MTIRLIGEPGEQCTVVFALIVIDSATECVCVERQWGMLQSPPPRRFKTMYAKTTLHYSPDCSMVRLIITNTY